MAEGSPAPGLPRRGTRRPDHLFFLFSPIPSGAGGQPGSLQLGGRGGFNRVWLNESNDWIYPWLHQAERAMINLARRDFKEGSLEHRACCQAVRELLLAQSSDWPFILTNRTVVEYAQSRIEDHLGSFFNLYRGLKKERWKRAI
ncbi:MAG TPA: DUF1957 domain-containing protein [Moorella mulderi]|nr:DUF1957 domain-containing protein [Moorella mulderi]